MFISFTLDFGFGETCIAFFYLPDTEPIALTWTQTEAGACIPEYINIYAALTRTFTPFTQEPTTAPRIDVCAYIHTCLHTLYICETYIHGATSSLS